MRSRERKPPEMGTLRIFLSQPGKGVIQASKRVDAEPRFWTGGASKWGVSWTTKNPRAVTSFIV